MIWKYHTMMYADRYPIQFRQNVVSGEIQMRVEPDPAMTVPEWLRVDDWDSPLGMPLNLN